MDVIHQVFKDFDSNLISKITDIALTKSIPKKEYFLTEGQINDQLAIVNKGYLQSFYNKDGNEITTYIAGPGKLVVSLSSYLNQTPSREYIRTLIDSELVLLNKNDVDKLINEYETFKKFYTKTLEHQIVCIDESRFDFITLSAEERYLKLLNDEPEILQHVNLRHIATNLGITERQLTRIRKKIVTR